MNPTRGNLEEQQRLYATSREHVRNAGMSEAEAAAHYSTYADFVARSSPHKQGRLLDVGCGNGWSSHLFATRGFDVTGVDLNPACFEPPARPGLQLLEGSALDLPFGDASFDLVTSYQAIEHVPDPETMLREMIRVARSGGTITIVSPNLLSTLASLRGITHHCWKNRPASTIFFRSPQMPRHPWGNTLPECVGTLIGNAARVAAKAIASGPRFSMRDPDLRPPFHADNDACYVCNPIDLVKYFRSRGCRILQNGQYGRPPLSWLASSGTFVTAAVP